MYNRLCWWCRNEVVGCSACGGYWETKGECQKCNNTGYECPNGHDNWEGQCENVWPGTTVDSDSIFAWVLDHRDDDPEGISKKNIPFSTPWDLDYLVFTTDVMANREMLADERSISRWYWYIHCRDLAIKSGGAKPDIMRLPRYKKVRERGLQGGAPFDPDEYMSNIVVNVAIARDEVVTGKLIVEATMEGILRPGTLFEHAAQTLDYEKTRQRVVNILDLAGLDHMVAEDLRLSTPPIVKLQPNERVKLAYQISTSKQEYPEGSFGRILDLFSIDSSKAKEFADAGDVAVQMDSGGIIRVPDFYLERGMP